MQPPVSSGSGGEEAPGRGIAGRCPFLADHGWAGSGAACPAGGDHAWAQFCAQSSSISGSSTSSSSDGGGGSGSGAANNCPVGGTCPYADGGPAPAPARGMSRSSSAASTGSTAPAWALGGPAPAREPGRAASGAFQAWALKRPREESKDPRTRRALRQLGRAWTLREVAAHRTADDAWIAVAGRVYDITAHVASHPGWDGAGITTVLSILAALGTDCTADFEEIHRPWPVAWRQLAAYDIGPLAQ